MPHTDHQQNETTPTGGRDLGQITLQTISLKELFFLANNNRIDGATQQQLDHVARQFVIELFATIGEMYGQTAGNTFAAALGFDHLIED